MSKITTQQLVVMYCKMGYQVLENENGKVFLYKTFPYMDKYISIYDGRVMHEKFLDKKDFL